MSEAPASFLGVFRAHLAGWFEQPVPAELGRQANAARSEDDDASEAERRSIHEVTLEQLGISHWSCHSQF